MRKIIEDMKTHHGLKTHHRSYKFLDDISECQEWTNNKRGFSLLKENPL